MGRFESQNGLWYFTKDIDVNKIYGIMNHYKP